MGETFFQYMRQVPKHLADRIGTAMDHAVKAIADGSQSSYDAVSKELCDIQQHVNSETMEAARGELRERLMGQFRVMGHAAEKAESLAESNVKTLWDKAEALRKASAQHTLAHAGRWAWLKIVALGAAAVAGVSWVSSQGAGEGASILGGQAHIAASLDDQQRTQEIAVTRARFDELVDNLAPPQIDLPQNAPANAGGADTPRAATPAPVAAPPMPLAVASIAATPATVTVYDNGRPVRTSQTDVGNVWTRAPEVRRPIEERSSGHNIHGDINVTAPFGPSISIRF